MFFLCFFLIFLKSELYNEEGDFIRCEKYDQNIIIKNGTKRILNGAFQNCQQLWKLVIPDSVEYIDDNAFFDFHPNNPYSDKYFTTNLVKIFVFPNNPNFCSIDDVLYTKNMDELILCPPNRENKHFEIPETVKILGNGAFFRSSIQHLTFPHNLRSIGDGCFMCIDINSLIIPDPCERIGNFAFFHAQIKRLQLPLTLKEIGDFIVDKCVFLYFSNKYNTINQSEMQTTFVYEKSLLMNREKTKIILASKDVTQILLPETVEVICKGSFTYFKENLELIIPKRCNLHTIEDFAFYQSVMDNVLFPQSLKKIGNYAFFRFDRKQEDLFITKNIKELGVAFFTSKSLKNITIDPHNKYFDIYNKMNLITKDKKRILLTAQWNCFGSISFTGNKFLYIDDYAFYSCWLLNEINFNNNLKFIGKSAFRSCSMLRNVYFTNKVVIEDIFPYTFAFCEISNISLPNSVKRIHDFAFLVITSIIPKIHVSKDSLLENIGNITATIDYIPKYVSNIQISPFYLKYTTKISKENKYFKYINKTLYSKDLKRLISVISCKNETYHIYETVKILSTNSITEELCINKIVIPKSLEIIEENAINIPTFITLIFPSPYDSQLFCIFPHFNLKINNKILQMPNNILVYPTNLFADLHFVQNFHLSKNLEFIDHNVIDKTSAISLYIEDKLEYIMKDNLKHIISLNINQSNPFFSISKTIFGTILLDKKQTTVICGLRYGFNYAIVIPETVKIIKYKAFDGIQSEELFLPTNVEIIEPEAFQNCQLLSIRYGNYRNTSHIKSLKQEINNNKPIILNKNMKEINETQNFNSDKNKTNSSINNPTKTQISNIKTSDLLITNDNKEINNQNNIKQHQNINLLIKNQSNNETIEEGENEDDDEYEELVFDKENMHHSFVPENPANISLEYIENNKEILESKLKEIGYGAFFGDFPSIIALPPSIAKLSDLFCNFGSFPLFINNSYFINYKNKYFTDKTGTKLLRMITHKKYLKIHKGIKEIGRFAFAGSQLEYVSLPETLEKISSYAFANNYKLKRIEFANNSRLRSISDSAFLYSGIFSITFPPSLEYIGPNCFKNCFRLTNVSLISTKITILHEETFSCCNSLIEVYLPENIDVIGYKCFFECYKLSLVKLNHCHIISITSNAFELTKINTITDECENKLMQPFNQLYYKDLQKEEETILLRKDYDNIRKNLSSNQELEKLHKEKVAKEIIEKRTKRNRILAFIFAIFIILLAFILPTSYFTPKFDPSETESLLENKKQNKGLV